jgi:hypothetical protein
LQDEHYRIYLHHHDILASLQLVKTHQKIISVNTREMKAIKAYNKKIITYTNSKVFSFLFKMLIGVNFLLMAFTITAKAQCNNMPALSFHSPVLTYGTDKEAGAVYRFAGVMPGVDADVEIMGIFGGATLYNIDDSAGIGYYDAFQPYVGAAPNATSYIDWKITFKAGGTSTDTLLSCLAVTGVDVDGDGASLQEFIEAATPGSIAVDPYTILKVSFDGVRSKAISLVNNIPSIDTAHREAMFQMNFANISTLLYRNGAISTYGSQEIRQTSIYFRPFFQTFTLLPVKLLSFTARQSGKEVVLNWTAANEQDTKNYTIQKSTDGTYWKNINTVTTGTSSAINNYFITDFENNIAVTYYRLKVTDINNRVTSSNIIRFNSGNISGASFSHNTIISTAINIQVTTPVKDEYSIIVYNLSGNIIKQQQSKVYAGNSSIVIEMPRALPPGIYLLTVKNHTEQQVYNSKIIKN